MGYGGHDPCPGGLRWRRESRLGRVPAVDGQMVHSYGIWDGPGIRRPVGDVHHDPCDR